VVVISAVSVSKSEPQCRGGLVRKNSGVYGEKAIKRGRGQHMAAMICRRRADGSDRLGCGRQRDSLHNHLFDFRLVHGQYLYG